jgi:hypothetical protein
MPRNESPMPRHLQQPSFVVIVTSRSSRLFPLPLPFPVPPHFYHMTFSFTSEAFQAMLSEYAHRAQMNRMSRDIVSTAHTSSQQFPFNTEDVYPLQFPFLPDTPSMSPSTTLSSNTGTSDMVSNAPVQDAILSYLLSRFAPEAAFVPTVPFPMPRISAMPHMSPPQLPPMPQMPQLPQMPYSTHQNIVRSHTEPTPETDIPEKKNLKRSKSADDFEPTQGKKHNAFSKAVRKKIRNEFQRNLVCHNCSTTSSPLWRRTRDKVHALCNACGLYQKQYDLPRPFRKVVEKDQHLLTLVHTDGDSARMIALKQAATQLAVEKGLLENVKLEVETPHDEFEVQKLNFSMDGSSQD